MQEFTPLNDTVFLRIVFSDENAELRESLEQSTEAFAQQVQSKRLLVDLSLETRRLDASLSSRPQAQMGEVIAIGEEVDPRMVRKGDILIFPLHMGSMLTITQPDGTFSRVFAIPYSQCLARYRED